MSLNFISGKTVHNQQDLVFSNLGILVQVLSEGVRRTQARQAVTQGTQCS